MLSSLSRSEERVSSSKSTSRRIQSKSRSRSRSRCRSRSRSKSPSRRVCASSPRHAAAHAAAKRGASGLQGGRFIGAGTFGCSFVAPLATLVDAGDAEKVGKEDEGDAARLGKVMKREDAEDELDAQAPFKRVDPSGRFGLYALSQARRVDPSRAAASAGGEKELDRCALTARGSAARAFFDAANAATPAERARAWERAEADATALYQLQYSFARGGDMAGIVRENEAELARARGVPALSRVRAQLVAFSNLARGLAAYHAANLVHRDIKAANIVLDGAAFKFIDFGESATLRDAVQDAWQAQSYVYFPAVARYVFTPALERSATTRVEIEGEQARLGAPYAWLPRWLRTRDGVHETFDAAMRGMQLYAAGPRKRALAVCAALHTDIFQLALALGHLFSSLTGASFRANDRGRVVVAAATGSPALAPELVEVGALVGSFIRDATRAELWAEDLAPRFSSILAALA